MILAMNGTVILLVLASAVLHASWNFAMRSARGDLLVIWLSLMLAGVAGMPMAIAYGLWYPPHAAGTWYLLASCVLNALFFSLLGKAYEGGEISLVYPVSRGTGVALTGVIALALAIDPLSPLALAGMLAVVAGILMIGLGHVSSGLGGHSKAHSIGLAVLVGLCIAGYSITDKLGVSARRDGLWPGGQMHPVIYVCGQYFGTAMLMIPYVLTRPARQIAEAWNRWRVHVLFIGPASLLTYLPILLAYRLGPVSSIVAFREVAVVLGCVLGFAVLKESMPARKLAGIAAVLAGLILIKLGNW
jgi:drug/metabolite transporter (DMT)-like permease